MDSTDSFAIGGGAVGIASLVFVIMTRLYKACNHKRFRSKCNDKEVVMSVDIESTTPPTAKISALPPAREAFVSEFKPTKGTPLGPVPEEP